MTTTHIESEIASQPEMWARASDLVPDVRESLPQAGERVAVVGCGTSWFMAMSYAALREDAGHGVTDAFAGSEFPAGRSYDRVIAITRSGTTSEIVSLLKDLEAPTTVITAVPDSPAGEVANHAVVMPFADEKSVVQTRFATTTLALLRAHLGEDLGQLIADAKEALELPVEDLTDVDQSTFLGRGWTIGLAAEAALKTREAAQFWAESYPAMDYRHGPISIAQPGRLVWCFGLEPDGLAGDVAETGARFVRHNLDPQASLVAAQRFAVGLAKQKGLDPDHPRALSRSVILT